MSPHQWSEVSTNPIRRAPNVSISSPRECLDEWSHDFCLFLIEKSYVVDRQAYYLNTKTQETVITLAKCRL